MCVKVPDPTLPVLGGGLSVPAIPAPGPFTAGLCCKFFTLTAAPFPPIPLVSANTAALVGLLRVAKEYYRAFLPKCPRN